jgi:hypothetical protein
VVTTLEISRRAQATIIFGKVESELLKQMLARILVLEKLLEGIIKASELMNFFIFLRDGNQPLSYSVI